MRRLQCLLSGQHSCPRHVPCHGRQMCHLPAEGAPAGLDAPLPAPAHSLWSPPGHVPWGRATAISHCRPLRPCPALSPGSWPAPAPGCSLLLRLCPGPAPSARGAVRPGAVASPLRPPAAAVETGGPVTHSHTSLSVGRSASGESDAQPDSSGTHPASPRPQALGPWLALSSSSPGPGRQRVSVKWGRLYLPGPPQGPGAGSISVELWAAPTHA